MKHPDFEADRSEHEDARYYYMHHSGRVVCLSWDQHWKHYVWHDGLQVWLYDLIQDFHTFITNHGYAFIGAEYGNLGPNKK